MVVLFKTIKEFSEKHRLLLGLLALAVAAGIVSLDYLWHPEARALQSQMERELRAFPVPPESVDEGFTSGFQPKRGRAERRMASSLQPKDACYYYSLLLNGDGWKPIHAECIPWAGGQELIQYRKGEITCTVFASHEAPAHDGYAIVLTWMH